MMNVNHKSSEKKGQERFYSESPGDPRKMVNAETEHALIGLYRNMVILLPDAKSRVIQFMASRRGEGTSTLIREFAKVAALKLGKTVLLVDADPNHSGHAEIFNVSRKPGWEETCKNGASVSESLCQVGETSLFVSCFSRNSDCPSVISEFTWIETFLGELRQKFDLILIDFPPPGSHAESLLLTHTLDGVVLVVETEKSRWQVLEKMKKRIANQGVNILGVILNKRRYPIPKFIYDRI
ncbi:hypothetical protein DENIS_4773 [Desulfonema ishimotonii]|uniref:Uncharacterized protein n=1 Tax=Desulfonema ishimotonii TaxID=45657 RepID=A0A401G3T2_9BACT|nr:CpsD/CapB family tyrosine-protein kinase [Desulfonema ishimotonii]GBC63775.1 hypothetical protein DENIS_4773 [Desulfonema ishimotonii]